MHPNLLTLLMTSGKLTIRLHITGVKKVRLTYGVTGYLFGRGSVPSLDQEVNVSEHKYYPTILLLLSCPSAYRYLITKMPYCSSQKHMSAVKRGI